MKEKNSMKGKRSNKQLELDFEPSKRRHEDMYNCFRTEIEYNNKQRDDSNHAQK